MAKAHPASKVQAMKNHEYMTRFSHQQSDPFVCSSERKQDNVIINLALNRRAKCIMDLVPTDLGPTDGVNKLKYLADMASFAGPWEKSNRSKTAQAITSTRGQMFRRDIWTRLGAGCVSGLFLIGPMWLLTLKAQEVFLQLGVTSGCVVVFGLLMAWVLPTIETVFAATLAYAAVLMVFVGVVMQGIQSRGV